MTNWADDAEKQYSALAEYAALRTDELGRMLKPTFCGQTRKVGNVP